MLHRSLLALSALIFGAAVAMAEVYSYTDENGTVHFSDTPSSGATLHKVSPVETVKSKSYIHFEEANGAMLVQAKVNGIPVVFIVDTGASLVIIPVSIASSANIDTSGSETIPLQTANGEVQVPQVSLNELLVDSVLQRSVRAAVHDIKAGVPVGLLGMSFFSAYRMTIDHERKLIELEQR